MEIDQPTTNAIQLSVLNEAPIELKIVQDNPSIGIENDTLESLSITDDSAIELHETQDAPIALGVGVEFIDRTVPTYTGEYEFIPGEEDQVVHIDGMKASQDILVHAVPENYVRMSFSGNVITFY